MPTPWYRSTAVRPRAGHRGAELLVISDMGHEIPPVAQPEVVAAIVANARRGSGPATVPRTCPGDGPARGYPGGRAGGDRSRPLHLHAPGRRRCGRAPGGPATGRPPAPAPGPHWDLLNRSRRSVAVNLKHADGVAPVARPRRRRRRPGGGVAAGRGRATGCRARTCWARNPRLVYGRMTGWGQDGPLASAAGHDINYIAVAGALWPIGRAGERPVPPLNLVGDFGGGGMMLAFGMWRPSSRRSARAVVRSSTRPWSTGPPRS